MAAPGDFLAWLKAYAEVLKTGSFAPLRALATSKEVRHQVEKPLYRVNKNEGPMLFIGQQIVKRMEKMGYPSKIAEHWRTPERQAKLFFEGRSKIPSLGAHVFGEAVDIVHKELNWDAPAAYWDALAVAVRVIAADYRVDLVHGHYWRFVDSAHIELKDWRKVRDRYLHNHPAQVLPTEEELFERWHEVLPGVPHCPDFDLCPRCFASRQKKDALRSESLLKG